jgi:NADH-quinone oxidoreductase subunit M
MFGLFTFASIGLPGLSGFVGEFLVILGAFRYHALVAAVAMVVVIISAVYMLWMFQRAFFTVPSDWMQRYWPKLRDMNRSEWIALSPLIFLVVALGVYPAPVLEMLAAPVDRIIQAVTDTGMTGLGPLW